MRSAAKEAVRYVESRLLEQLFAGLDKRLDAKLPEVVERLLEMARLDIAALRAAVTKIDTVTDSVLEMLARLSAQITDLSNRLGSIQTLEDAEAIQHELGEMADTLNTEAGRLADAVKANTPVASEPPASPPPTPPVESEPPPA